MKLIKADIVNAFTKNGGGGNPAAVVLDADHLSAADRQTLAAKTGLSETAFVTGSLTADFRLSFYTPTRQIAHCGHATIATFFYLKQIGRIGDRQISSNETVDGNREVRFVDNEVYMQQSAPEFIQIEDSDLAAVAASLNRRSLDDQRQPLLVNTGNTFLILEVADENELQSIVPDFRLITEISEKYGLIGYYIFCNPHIKGIDATARMFAPAYGISEESATGMAAGPLACYLFEFREKKESYAIEQGRFMEPSLPSLIKVRLAIENNKVTALYAGGTATLMRTLEIEI